MNQKIKNYLSIFNKPNKKWGILALLSFIIFVGCLLSQPAFAQSTCLNQPPGGLGCNFWSDPVAYAGCKAAEFILSALIKLAVLLFLGLPLIISALVAGIMCLVLGWILSADFISLKFTNNAFVNIGLSITKNFANMGFILFLVVIALATVLRIEEYKAKKTLPTLILIALLVNFSPVFCGVIIDFSNIVMKFFTDNISGLTGFSNFLMNSFTAMWNSLVATGFDIWANIGAAMQVLVMVIFNFYTAYVFILFCALFIVRYVMLWILVILSPIAFVSYILPITRGGGSLLSWRKWWEQLIAWSLIGIIAGFFIYLGFTMISMINNNFSFISQPTSANLNCAGGLGLMNNVLPYLIPLVLLHIAYIELKRTQAMFAGEVISATEKVTKGAAMAGAMIATTGLAGALRAMPQVSEREASLRRGLERIPGVGRMVGGPGAYDASMKKQTEKEKKKLEGRDSDALHEIVEQRPLGLEGRHKRAAAMELLGEKGRLRDEEERYIQEAERFGADMKPIIQARPEWAHHTIQRDDTGNIVQRTPQEAAAQVISRMDPGEARKKIQADSLQLPEVFYEMNLRQIEEMGRRGTEAQKRALVTLIRTNTEIFDEFNRLTVDAQAFRIAGMQEDADRLQEQADRLGEKIVEIEDNPDFH